MATDRQTDRRTSLNNRDNVLFASLLIGLSVDFFAMVARARARACGVRARVCVRESVRAFVCACYCQDAVTKIHKHIFVNIQPS